MRNGTLAALGLGALLALGGVSATSYAQVGILAKTIKPAAVQVNPTGATLKPGDTLQFTATVYDQHGNPLSGFPIAWSSSSSSVIVDQNGLVTAHSNGSATITAKAGSKKNQLTVTVVTNPQSGEAVLAGPLKQVNHLLLDDNWIYWTEVDPKLIRVRKMARGGGPIFDVVSEAARTPTGASETYVHLQQSADTLYYSRQTVGFGSHWSIRAIPKAGGTPTTIMPENASATPMYENSWRVVGKYIVVALFYPSKLHLPDNTRIAYYDTEAGTWNALVSGANFDINKIYIVASDDQDVYLRGFNYDGKTVTLRMTPGSGQAPITLHSMNDLDIHYSDTGTKDDQFLYFWSKGSQSSGDDRLVALPITGGSLKALTSGNFGPGLATDGQNVYWARNETAVVKSPVTGGAPTVVRQKIYTQSTLGPLAVADDGIYLAVVPQQSKINLVRDPK